eukprot:Lankesteria_metandrocarpae@DN828_c0_g1_i1.p1
MNIVGLTWRQKCDIDNHDYKSALQGSKLFGMVRKFKATEPWPPQSDEFFRKNSVHPHFHERGLITVLLAKIQEIDPDIVVGHNICGFDLEVLASRFMHYNLPFWHKASRLKQYKPLRAALKTGMTQGGAVRLITVGRLVCDTYLQARELLKSQPSYSLQSVVAEVISDYKPTGAAQSSGSPTEPDIVYETAQNITSAVLLAMNDAVLSMRVMWKLQALPLTRELSCLAGNLWYRSLQNARAERNEYFLLHRFHEAKFMCPDTYHNRYASSKNKLKVAARSSSVTANPAADSKVKQNGRSPDELQDDHVMGEAGDDAVPSNVPAEKTDTDRPNKKQKALYAGGLVLEPKSGLYDKYILLLDFNSLYPSIIQEFNVCFTTVSRPDDVGYTADFEVTDVDSTPGILPVILRSLVDRRKSVKQLIVSVRGGATSNASLSSAADARLQTLNIRQLALKLTANSMYGCLGFTNSRFYSPALAAYITKQGRLLLQSAKRIVETDLGLEVVYGDTDSIMVSTGLEDDGTGENFKKAKEIGDRVKWAVNKDYKKLELDLECIFSRLLLLKKKKYACVKVIDYAKGLIQCENKGLDIVRRDWCSLTKIVGNKLLSIMFGIDENSGKLVAPDQLSIDSVVERVHDLLSEVSAKLDTNEIPLDQFVITKALTKLPHQYADAKSQPHVMVAKRLLEFGQQVQVGLEIPYIICSDNLSGSTGGCSTGGRDSITPNENNKDVDMQQNSNQNEAPVTKVVAVQTVAERARHPSEVKSQQLTPDIEWYKDRQLLPVVGRLCGHVEGTTLARLAECLGLKVNTGGERLSSNPISGGFNDTTAGLDSALSSLLQRSEERFMSVRLTETYLRCPFCEDFSEVEKTLKSMTCPNCHSPLPEPFMTNWLRLHLRALTMSSFKFEQSCRECGVTSRHASLTQAANCPQAACPKPRRAMEPALTPFRVLLHLQYLEWLLSSENAPLASPTTAGPPTQRRTSLLASVTGKEDDNNRQQINTRGEMQSRLQKIVIEQLQRNKYNQLSLNAIFRVFQVSDSSKKFENRCGPPKMSYPLMLHNSFTNKIIKPEPQK